SSIKRWPRASRQATASFTASALPTITSQIWLVNAAICFLVSKRISGSRLFASKVECIERSINDRWCSKSCAAFSSIPQGNISGFGENQINVPLVGEIGGTKLEVLKACATNQRARCGCPNRQGGCATNRVCFSGQNLMEGGQKCLHLVLFADGQAHVIWQCRK